MDLGRPYGPNWTEQNQIDQSKPNGIEWTEYDWIERSRSNGPSFLFFSFFWESDLIELKWTEVDWIGPKLTKVNWSKPNQTELMKWSVISTAKIVFWYKFKFLLPK